MSDIHLGDIGTVFILTIMDGAAVVDISAATTMEIIMTDPSSGKTTHTAQKTTDGTDGKMEYATTAANVLDEIGTWQWQGRVVLPTGDWKTNILTFAVLDNL
jgi:hypothetical protein